MQHEDGMQRRKELSLRLFIVMNRAVNWVNKHAEEDIQKSGLTQTEFAVMELLYHKGRQPLQQIGQKVLISSGNITYVVDKLEKKGLLQRKPCPTDRRVIYAEVTEQGEKLIAEAFVGHELALMRAMEGLSDEELQEAAELLKRLGLHAEQRYKG
ncbi:MarR family transcriptional regulator [Paenibacillus sp. GD4]|uniref:MarR family winged helix-turn-helix transcriptional regulator n=1 Tax=Paenibacillus sp. GD4 TaxID=3068890 RepID=UPI002796547B|nr:MarR family transcriptional regulator [Paenibacillus sp. GD4]MDQ1912061.1 MarR family transcriptional regulator [Paenibacillus sp. GD4]